VRIESSPARLTAGPLSVRAAGRIRTNDLPLSQKAALSAELQRHASRNLNVRDRKKFFDK
jgi:hypothetical protein